MGYSIHIARVNESGNSFDDEGNRLNPISLDEWKAAVEAIRNVRLASDGAVFSNPGTEEIISIPNSGGDAEVYFPADSEWIRVYSWFGGALSFRWLPSFDEPDDPVRIATHLLAAVLKARIIGDEGEFYQ
jgi:hypothetical protein